VFRSGIVALLLSSLISGSIFCSTLPYAIDRQQADAWIRIAIEKMGGEQKLRSLKSIQIEKIGHTYSIEQSERPEGPWLANYEQIVELRDYANGRLRRTTQTRSIQAPQWTPAIVLKVADGAAALQFGERSGPASATDVAEADETLELSAERVLLTALEAPDLHVQADVALQGSTQHVVAFSWHSGLVRIYLNTQTAMPTAVEVERSYPGSFFWGPWGNVTSRMYLSLWTLEAGGIRYPRQLDIERNGIPYQSFTIPSLTLNPELPPDSFLISGEVKKAYEATALRSIDDLPLGQPNKPATEFVPGVVQIPGPWNVTLVRQSDGVVVIEAPISSGYSNKVLAEAKKRFPELPIKAVVSTSDAWPHIGGIREYVVRDIPVYALDLNRPILERLISSPHRSHPDALEVQRKKPKFRIVNKKTIIGTGPNRIELYPIRTESGERMIMAFFPEQNMLYASDLVQQRRDGSFFMPEYLSEVQEATTRETLTVKSVFGMHLGLKPWQEIETAITKALTAY
jgi:hypothetical protein